jgi:hypothetical protein
VPDGAGLVGGQPFVARCDDQAGAADCAFSNLDVALRTTRETVAVSNSPPNAWCEFLFVWRRASAHLALVGFLVLNLGTIAQACVKVVRPYWTINRAVWRLLRSSAGSALFCWLIQANVLVAIDDVSVRPSLPQRCRLLWIRG